MFIFKVDYESVSRMVIESGLLLSDVYVVMELRSLLVLSIRLNLAIYKIHGYKTSIPSSINASLPHRLAAGQITTSDTLGLLISSTERQRQRLGDDGDSYYSMAMVLISL
jgi:hypothetical protein